MTRDFTLEKYTELCSAIVESGYHPLTFSSYVKSGNKSDEFIILRHDIDRKPLNALRMAELEYEQGIIATYYFRYPSTFNREIISKIVNLHHEIGYHYEVLSKAKGDSEKALEMFERELNEFRKIWDVKTICMHGSPLSSFDNRNLWNDADFKDYGIVGEAYLSAGSDLAYISDTGRSWDWKNKIRDRMDNNYISIHIDSTDGLIGSIRKKEIDKLYILIHPERWAIDQRDWYTSYLIDHTFNLGKSILKVIRK